jgi:hypothetical protein
VTPDAEDGKALCGSTARSGTRQGCLAHARPAGDGDELRPSAPRIIQQVREKGKLRLAAHEGVIAIGDLIALVPRPL